ncbi:MAG: HlyC/CorC family transporter [Candidatus Koribacter versatilis]|uniref:HlyC/CorC family transporter n=1 Tax=Candidatus Korobacter versatilis TaxID=658062 RepID=A0A932A7K9_9BACT|nr:HlyC/CorC family transporter [Candidatus Koribacter versatilis]
MIWAIIPAMAVLLGLLTLVSYVERVYNEMGKFLAREFQENIECFERDVEARLGVARNRASLSMSVLAQLTTAAISLLTAYYVFYDGTWNGGELARAGVIVVLAIIIFNRLLPFVLFTRTRGDWVRPLTFLIRLLIWIVFPITIILGFALSVASLAESKEPQQPEHPSEAVDALIEAGQEEGILEEADRDMIHSVVEFSEKRVHEVMTPRPEVVAVPLAMSVEQFIELQRTKPYSRVPVYEGETIDHIKGVVFAHDVLQVPDTEAKARTVGEMMRSAFYVPETKRVSQLLREMQREGIHMAIVIDEYGSLAGVVTIEDLVEEIVGEIRDEHEAKADIVHENPNSYVVPGNMDVDRIPQLFGIRLESREATSVGGLVSELMGRIPEPGAVVDSEGLRFEVLDSSDRRVERVRISLAKDEPPLPPTPPQPKTRQKEPRTAKRA